MSQCAKRARKSTFPLARACHRGPCMEKPKLKRCEAANPGKTSEAPAKNRVPHKYFPCYAMRAAVIFFAQNKSCLRISRRNFTRIWRKLPSGQATVFQTTPAAGASVRHRVSYGNWLPSHGFCGLVSPEHEAPTSAQP